MAQSIWVALLSSEVRIIQGKKYRTRIVEAGSDHPETLVLIHGGGGHIESFAHNIVPLGRHFHTISMDMLWHGLSDAPPIEDPTVQIGEQILDLMDALGKDKVWIHGEAAGAGPVRWIGLNHPERLNGLIFEGAGGAGGATPRTASSPPPPLSKSGQTMGQLTLKILENPTWDLMHERLLMVMHKDHPEHVTDELVDIRMALYSRPDTNDGMTRYYQYTSNRGGGSRYEHPFADEQKDQLGKFPVLVLGSEWSGIAGPQPLESPPGLIPGAQFKVLMGTGIWSHWESPAEFNESVRQFIMGEKAT
jgi:pimeloyl-ACP methyl ester carboxylesterase